MEGFSEVTVVGGRVSEITFCGKASENSHLVLGKQPILITVFLFRGIFLTCLVDLCANYCFFKKLVLYS